VPALDHLEQGLARFDNVQPVLDVALDVLDHSRPFDLAKVGVNDYQLIVRDPDAPQI
jgi:hypothetical protein